jgi:glycine/sarcosine N-methyltransferase
MTDPAESFYDRLAGMYDAMTDFDARQMKEEPAYRRLVDLHKIRKALDAGCGTGFHSLLLSRLGVEVTATDVSAEMVERVRHHVREAGLAVTTVQSDFRALASRVAATFDAVFCLGNSLPHLLAEEDLANALKNFHALLRPGGVVIIQIVNYERILAGRERVLNVRTSGGATYVRFYDYDLPGGLLRFNILTLDEKRGRGSHVLDSILLRPWIRGEVDAHLTRCGFTDATAYGSVALSPYDPVTSPDLVLLARRA